MAVPERPKGIQPRAWKIATAHLKDGDPVPTKVTVSATTECPDCEHDCKDCTCDDCECEDCD